MKVYSHHLVRNEVKWLWYSVMSVINYVDKILLWDMESEDKTPQIIEEIKRKYPDKVIARRVPKVTPEGFAGVRQTMLDETDADWFLVVDGDEVWWEESIKQVVKVIRSASGKEIESIVVPMVIPVGDIYHYQGQEAGRYTLAGHKGHFSLRAVNRNIPGLSSSKPHGTWGWTDGKGCMIQDRDYTKIAFVEAPYLHTTHLKRAGSIQLDKKVIKRGQKLKYEIGRQFPLDYYYPEVFFERRPDFVLSPWETMNARFYARSLVETPLRHIKRRLIKGKIGY